MSSISPKTDLILKFLHVITWIIFIALCYQTGALMFNYAFMQFRVFPPENQYLLLDLTELFSQSEVYFGLLFGLAIGVNGLTAYTFYLITLIFQFLNLHKPFSPEISKLITKISYYILTVGIVGAIAQGVTQELAKQGYPVENAFVHWKEYPAFLMMAAVVFVIAQVFKKGLELQNESDLTV